MKKSKLFLTAISLIWAVSCDIVLDPSTVNFETNAASGLESTQDYFIAISIDKPLVNDLTIDLDASGTADPFLDYSMPSFIDIPAGSTSANIDLFIKENFDYSGEDKTIIVNMSSSEIDLNAMFGDNTTFTYTIMDNELAVELSWEPTSGSPSDYDLDLYLYKSTDLVNVYSSSTSIYDVPEVLTLTQNDSEVTYYAVAHYYSGDLSDVSVDYDITIKFPDGTTSSHNDTFDANTYLDRTLFSIVKNGDGNFSTSKDPLGSSGRQQIPTTVKKK